MPQVIRGGSGLPSVISPLGGGRKERAADRESAGGTWCCLAGARDRMGVRADLCSRGHLPSLSGLIAAMRGEVTQAGNHSHPPSPFLCGYLPHFLQCFWVWWLSSQCIARHPYWSVCTVCQEEEGWLLFFSCWSACWVWSLNGGHLRFVVHEGQGQQSSGLFGLSSHPPQNSADVHFSQPQQLDLYTSGWGDASILTQHGWHAGHMISSTLRSILHFSALSSVQISTQSVCVIP